PWLRASEATRVRRRQINGLGRAIGVLIGVLEFALGKIGVVGVAYVDRQRLAQNSRTVLPPFNIHNLEHVPTKDPNHTARIFVVGGYMLGERLLLLRRRHGFVAFVDDDPQPSARPSAPWHELGLDLGQQTSPVASLTFLAGLALLLLAAGTVRSLPASVVLPL